jgi:hypothetical protein
MFGYIMDYCKKNNINLDIYTNMSSDLGWLNFYKNYFNCNYIDFETFDFENNNYDKIILTTDDDRNYFRKSPSKKLLLDNKYLDKTISIDHYYKSRNSIKNQIGVRLFLFRPTIDWILPVYRLINLEKKVNNSTIVCLGSSIQMNFNNFNNFDKYKFILICRGLNTKYFEKYSNFTCYSNLNTNDMINILKNASYVYISKKNKEYIENKMSAAIPLAMNCLCTLIMPKKMNDIYKFKSAITYEDKINLIEPNPELVNEDLDDLLKHRDSIFDKYLLTQTA